MLSREEQLTCFYRGQNAAFGCKSNCCVFSAMRHWISPRIRESLQKTHIMLGNSGLCSFHIGTFAIVGRILGTLPIFGGLILPCIECVCSRLSWRPRHILMTLLSSNLATNSCFVVSDFLSDIGKVSKGYMHIGVFG